MCNSDRPSSISFSDIEFGATKEKHAHNKCLFRFVIISISKQGIVLSFVDKSVIAEETNHTIVNVTMLDIYTVLAITKDTMLTLKQFETFSLIYLFGTNVNYTLNDERSIRKGINFSKC